MMGTAMLTFSCTLSFAFLHSKGSPGIMLGKVDNEDGKGKCINIWKDAKKWLNKLKKSDFWGSLRS
jgi:hypothetical protein